MNRLIKKSGIISIVFITLLILITCNNAPPPQLFVLKGKALGTFYSISYYDTEGRQLQDELDSLFREFNHVLSIYDSSSTISKINRNELVDINEWFKEVYKTAEQVYNETDGAFDPSVAPLVNAWGFGFTNAEDMNQMKIDSILAFVGFDKIKLKDNKVVKEDSRMMLDFNAIAKGYCSDIAGVFLESRGISSYLVEIGGEIASKGKKPDGSFWKVGIEKPAQHFDDAQSVMQAIKINNKSLATSGNYRKYIEKNGKRYSHTIDPKTGYPSENNLLSVTVVTDRCVNADAYATAFMVMGLEKAFVFAEKSSALEAFFIYSDEKNVLQTKFTLGFKDLME